MLKNKRKARVIKKLTPRQERRWTSVGEREIRKYFQEIFVSGNWDYGYFKREGITTSLDLYSDKLKTIIEYDGIWHFKNIKGQLRRKQKVDARVEKWCKDNGWKLIRIKEEVYKSDKSFWINKLIKAVYFSNEMLVKFY